MPTWQTRAMARFTDAGIEATYRQIDYWCSQGLLGEHNRGCGPGSRRSYDMADFEVAHAIVNVRKLSTRVPLDLIAAVVRERPVDPDGELLVVYPSGVAHRFRSTVAPMPTSTPVIVVPLRSFAQVKAA